MMSRHPASSGGLSLAGEFSRATYEQWQQQVEKILYKSGLLREGEPAPDSPAAVLASTTYDGITVRPLYTEGASATEGYPGADPFIRGGRPQGNSGGWDIRQRQVHTDAATANREILADLGGGVTSLWLPLGAAGLPVNTLGDALHDVHLDMIGVVLDAGSTFAEAAEAFLSYAADQGVRPPAVTGNLGADPISVQARTGHSGDRAAAIDLARRCAADYQGLRALVVDALPYHDAGGSDAEELGCSLAAGVTYLRWLTEAGVDAGTAARLLEFRYAATTDQFATIAKLRAARRLWAQVARACGLPESEHGQRQHAVTSSAVMTRHDPWVNMLRGTIAAFAAGVGGADSVTVQPFDSPIGLPDPFARRIARNTQLLLLEESHLAQVIDPAGGSWYIESLTDELSRAAWQWFQRIEQAGGLPAALESGVVAKRLDDTWQQRREAVARRRDPITGVSEYPNLSEPVLRREAAPEPESGGLPRVRYAQDFEALRDASDTALASIGQRPQVFLATLGPLAVHTARASFARNLFAAGGIDSTEAGATDAAEEVVAAFEKADTPVVCLCSSDKVYAERAAETARALKQAGAEYVLLAGKPGDPPDGVDGFVHAGGNALEVLREVHRRLPDLPEGGVQR